VLLKLLRVFKPAGLTVCIFFSLSLLILPAHLGFPCKFLYSRWYIAVSKLCPGVLSGGGRCLFCSFRTANSTPLVSIRWREPGA
jgi:hypothetical protein